MRKLQPLVWVLYVLCLATLFAQVEIQIEGGAGWASALPTWRRTPQEWPALRLLWGGRPMTGYHLWAFSCVAAFFHMPFVMLWQWTPRLEARALGSTMLFWIVEDFLWFVLNPHFHMAAFHPGPDVWWHTQWFLGLPLDYWTFGITGSGLLALSFGGPPAAGR